MDTIPIDSHEKHRPVHCSIFANRGGRDGHAPFLQASISLAVNEENEEIEKQHMLGPSGSAFQQHLGRYQRAGMTREPVSVYTD